MGLRAPTGTAPEHQPRPLAGDKTRVNSRATTPRPRALAAGAGAAPRYDLAFEQAAMGAVISNVEGLPTKVNVAACRLLGRAEGALLGRSWDDYRHPDDSPSYRSADVALAGGQDTYEDERRYLRPDGSVIWLSAHTSLVRDEQGQPEYILTQFEDITRRKEMVQALAHQALHDVLTGLANRALITDRLVHCLASARSRGSPLGVIFFDIDHFKTLNDSLGHGLGDELLRGVAKRVTQSIREEDTVARFGGDEFVVVCNGATELELTAIAARVLEGLRRPFLIGSHEVNVSASAGIAIANDESTPTSLLRDSDAAMYQAKALGRDRIEVFNDALRTKVTSRLDMTSALHRALEGHEFVVYYQPIVDPETGAMVGAEALLRWLHPERGFLSPADFIPLAEETGLILPIGRWVMEEATSQLAEWHAIQPALTVAVNLSVRQLLAPDIVDQVKGVLDRSRLPPAALSLEITESVLIDDVDYCQRTIGALKPLRVRLAIDDFGTGYSSLNYLRQFPVDIIKVDRCFIEGLGRDPRDAELLAAIMAMARALDVEVIAEGVETEGQLANLRSLGCRRAQGFYLARPMPAADIARLLADGYRWPVAAKR